MEHEYQGVPDTSRSMATHECNLVDDSLTQNPDEISFTISIANEEDIDVQVDLKEDFTLKIGDLKERYFDCRARDLILTKASTGEQLADYLSVVDCRLQGQILTAIYLQTDTIDMQVSAESRGNQVRKDASDLLNSLQMQLKQKNKDAGIVSASPPRKKRTDTPSKFAETVNNTIESQGDFEDDTSQDSGGGDDSTEQGSRRNNSPGKSKLKLNLMMQMDDSSNSNQRQDTPRQTETMETQTDDIELGGVHNGQAHNTTPMKMLSSTTVAGQQNEQSQDQSSMLVALMIRTFMIGACSGVVLGILSALYVLFLVMCGRISSMNHLNAFTLGAFVGLIVKILVLCAVTDNMTMSLKTILLILL